MVVRASLGVVGFFSLGGMIVGVFFGYCACACVEVLCEFLVVRICCGILLMRVCDVNMLVILENQKSGKIPVYIPVL